ncbi:hypothetical protein OGAPHI_006906 [Ogataea philodendri]|uniref:Uncharacterized protein n=1 Tax=Ogataea philodendri TaxID=1378263 RepID=A0A9P8SZX2_9ASCO|nr:uncharacterized protein OGAPHI_006906 [Ogataea philodendri]KAH3660320.1 hypothetical protein OGAPHI_006906 [Ogataea philodendri]
MFSFPTKQVTKSQTCFISITLGSCGSSNRRGLIFWLVASNNVELEASLETFFKRISFKTSNSTSRLGVFLKNHGSSGSIKETVDKLSKLVHFQSVICLVGDEVTDEVEHESFKLSIWGRLDQITNKRRVHHHLGMDGFSNVFQRHELSKHVDVLLAALKSDWSNIYACNLFKTGFSTMTRRSSSGSMGTSSTSVGTDMVCAESNNESVNADKGSRSCLIKSPDTSSV